MVRHRWRFRLSIVAALALVSATAQAQTTTVGKIPADVLKPASDAGIPDLITGVNSLIRPEDIVSDFRFDTLLDPSNGGDPTRLTPAALSIIHNHMVAQQQVELSIRFLLANRDEIVAGNNATFNKIFGKVGKKKKVAVLAPVSLPGQFTLSNPTLLTSTAQGGGGGNRQTNIGSVGTQIRNGDFLFLVDPRSNVTTNNNNNNTFQRRVVPNLNTMGAVVKVAGIIENQRSANGQNQSQNSQIVLDPNFSNVSTQTTTNFSNVKAWRIVRFEEQNDPTVYEQVLATYQAIREALAGFDPSNDRATQTQTDITYRRAFYDINQEYAVGAADFAQLDPIINALIPGRGADRLVRQAGFSKSDSHYHLDRLEDIGNNATVDRKGDPTVPLLWSKDNDLPLVFNSRVIDPNANDESRAFFRDRQTIFGALDNPFIQWVGRAFLEEKILHDGEFFDTQVAIDNALLRGTRSQRSPAGGVIRRTGGGNTPLVDVIEDADIPETGKATEGKTLRKWQMILASFAEHDSDLTEASLSNPQIKHVAALGVLEILRGAASPELRASDAGSYALFSDLIRVNGGGGGVDFGRTEPIGKRGNAGFNPVVPTN